jgi:hypothetical protein
MYVQFSPDGSILTYKDGSGKLVVWDVQAQSVRGEIEGMVVAWNFTSTGRLVVRVADAVQIYTLDPFEQIAALPAAWDTFEEAIAPDGSWVAHVSFDPAAIQVWDTISQAMTELPLEIGSTVINLIAAPNSRTLAALTISPNGDQPVIRVWDLKQQAEIAALPAPAGTRWAASNPAQPTMIFSPDATRLAAAASQMDEETGATTVIIQVWDTGTFDAITLETAVKAAPLGLDFSPDGKLILLDTDAFVQTLIWDVAAQTQVATLGTNPFRAFSPDGKLLAFNVQEYDSEMSFDRAVGLWDATPSLVQMVWHETPVLTALFSPDGSTLFTLTQDGIAHAWGVEEAPPLPAAVEVVEYEGVSFAASTYTGEIVPPQGRWDGSQPPFWEVLPSYISLSIMQNDTTCLVRIFSAQDYNTMYPGTIDDLTTSLQPDSTGVSCNQDLWLQNASQMFASRQQLSAMANGQAWRFLTTYTQSAYPRSNPIYYQALGLTDEGQYFVQMRCPVYAWFMPNTLDAAALAQGLDINDTQNPLWQTFFDEFSSYTADLAQQVDSSADSSFQPSLAVLDALLASIQISDAPLGGTLPQCNFASRIAGTGTQARIVGDHHRLYSDPSFDYPIPGEFTAGIVIDLADGPVCADDVLWWHVGYITEKATGWIPEGRGENIWLEPVE